MSEHQDRQAAEAAAQIDDAGNEAEIRWDTWLDLAQARDENPRGVTAQQVWQARARWKEASAAERTDQAGREAEAG